MIVVVADDITGAAEIAGICLRYKLSVIFSIDKIPDNTADVLIIATNSRSLSENEARLLHANFAKQIRLLNPEFVFKKCDSVLRGHIAVETDVLAQEFCLCKIQLQPTNPSVGRIIKNQRYFIQDKLIENTGFSTDPDFPALSSEVSEILYRNQLKINTAIRIENCETEIALRDIACKYKNEKILVGSSAFFEQMLIAKLEIAAQEPPVRDFQIGNFVLLNGSMHPSGLEFAGNYHDKYPIVTIPAGLYLQDTNEEEISDFSDFLVNQYHLKKGIFIFTDPEIIKITKNQVFILDRTIAIINKLFTEKSVKQYFLTGGATAYAVMQAFGWNYLQPEEELAPGVLCLSFSSGKSQKVIIKPGSYDWGIEF